MNSRNNRLDEAAKWVIRLDDPDCAESVHRDFEQWLIQDARNRAAYLEMKQAWDHTDCLQARKPVAGQDQTMLQDPGLNGGHARRWWVSSLAATVALVIILGWITWPDSSAPFTWESFRTQVGEIREIVLEDGSRVHLNTDSELHVRLGSSARELELVRGEAAFSVAKDPGRPFEVKAAQSVVRAVGTQFAVRLIGANTVTLAVTEGEVLVGEVQRIQLPLPGRRLKDTSLLVNGQVGVAGPRGVAVRDAHSNDLSDQLAWRSGEIVFSGDQLEDVILEFNRYNVKQLIIGDPDISGLRVGGRFRAADLDSFICALDRSFGITAQPIGEGNVIRLLSSATGSSDSPFHCGDSQSDSNNA